MRFLRVLVAVLVLAGVCYGQAPVQKHLTGAKQSPRSKLVSTPKFKVVFAPPASHIVVPPKLSYFGNQTYGDCTSASEAFAKAFDSVAQGKPEIFVPEATVIAWARKRGFLNGANLTDVMDAMAKQGMVADDGIQYGDGVYSAVDWTAPSELKAALVTGPVKIGVASGQLQNAVGNVNGWVLVGAHADQSLDHCVELGGFGTFAEIAAALGTKLPPNVNSTALGYELATWNTIGIVDQGSLNAICGEAWIRNPTTVVQTTPPPTPPGPNPKPRPTRRMAELLKDLPALVDKYQTGTEAEQGHVLILLDKIEKDLGETKTALHLAP
jgi:hypothetical protein